jgi:UDP-N-acetylmuramyl pentapeptide phosphotransferase/UDP-N-acetylglucosamine-1-phosphate transferase
VTSRGIGAAVARAALTAAASAAVSRQLLRRWAGPSGARPVASRDRWTRTNHRGEPISLLEGPAFAVAAGVGVALAPGIPARVRAAALVAGAAAAGLGAYDDHAEQQVRKGLAGHLGALARGEITTGAVKVLGLTSSGLVASALLSRRERSGSRVRDVLDVLAGGAVVAGSANLVNLLDLRPGRAVKATLVAAPSVGGGGPVAAATAGAALGVLPEDLAERTMLGDTGANAAGALLGVAALVSARRRGRWALLAALVALTVASEKVSFTRVIDATPVLRELDAWGRRPPGPPPVTAG